MNVSLLGNDLILASQVQAVAQDSGANFVLCRRAPVPVSDLIFVDLNFDRAAVDEIVTLHGEQPAATIVGFCGHDEKEMRQNAMAAGASLCVTNGAVASTARRLIGSTGAPQ